MSPGLHHFQKRKRIFEKLEPYPHPDKWKNLFDKLIYVFGIFGPIMTIPQVTQIWIEKNAAGVSLVTWVAYLIVAVFWVFYGLLHKEKAIVFIYLVWIVLDALIVLGLLLYA